MILTQGGLRRHRRSYRRLAIGIALVLFFPVLAAVCLQWDREGAKRSWDDANRLHESLDAAPQPSRESYIKCVVAYQQVYLKDPHYGYSATAAYEAAKLFQEMGEKFNDLSYYKSAARLFRFVTTDYATSPYCADSLLRYGMICEGPIGDLTSAQAAYEKLRTHFRSSPAAASLSAKGRAGAKTPLPLSAPSQTAPAMPATPVTHQDIPSDGLAQVKSIQITAGKSGTRISIVTDMHVRYLKSTLSDPARVFFDIPDAALDHSLVNKTLAGDDQVLKSVRLGQNRLNVVRIVLDLNEKAGYSIVEASEAFGITVEIRESGTAGSRAETPPKPPTGNAPPVLKGPNPPVSALSSAAPQEAANTLIKTKGDAPPLKLTAIPADSSPVAQIVGQNPLNSPAITAKSKTDPATLETKPLPAPVPVGDAKANEVSSFPPKTDVAPAAVPPKPDKEVPSDAVSGGKEGANHPPAVIGKETKANPPLIPALPDSAPPPKTALPTANGDRTLTRMLGLKIGRIVLDPGHGGHDTGTTGPGGFLEKDLVLNVARQLKRLLEDRLGAEVILTRESDSFVSLEERTAIANRHKADLFISIHANSSTSRNTSGVETYFLDFARTASAREVAARENASTDHNVRDLQNLIRKIAQADKMEESKELAAVIQKSLFLGASRLMPASQNRGVRSAPFIVLIGANMPSVLAEISFLSNPQDEKLLKKETSQQSLADSLFVGIQGYMKALGTNLAQSKGNSN